MKKILSIILLGVLISGSFGTALAAVSPAHDPSKQYNMHFSEPIITNQDGYLTVQVNEASSSSSDPGYPVLPVYTKMLTFPLGTTITDVTCVYSSAELQTITQDVRPAPEPTPVSDTTIAPSSGTENPAVYSSGQPYPATRMSYQVGGGLDTQNNHVTILAVSYYPVQYSPLNHQLSFTPEMQLSVTYEPPRIPRTFSTGADLLIIAPAEFSDALQPLIDHKDQVGITTTLKTTEDIYAGYQGRDQAEQIKYAIKDAVETLGVSSVLLVGGVDLLPIRESQASYHGYTFETPLTDLYYSDLYDSHGNFSSWDANQNNVFGESSDQVDLYPDVNLGRLACASVDEVNTVVDKIIHYETETYGSDWYNTMIYIGGNTFRWSPGNDGEDLNTIIMGIVPQFSPNIIWTSKHNFNRRTISGAITDGAGFVDYSGHGFEFGMLTYTPSGLQKKYYYTRYIKDIKNAYKLPVIFFDACLTAKLDYVLQDMLDYRSFFVFNILAKALHVNTSQRLTCYAWAFMTHQDGGAVATIGATRTAFGGIDEGAGKISIEFFSAYNTSQYLGEMITQMQTGYINDVHNDPFTVEEFILLGDPTLKLGGYPAGN